MRSRIPSGIRWTRHKTKEELLDDPLAESLYGLFLKVKDSPRHIAIKPEKLINEVFYICNHIYQDADPCAMMEYYIQEIESDLGWIYATDLVMSMVYVVLKSQSKNPSKVEKLILSLEKVYRRCCYWNECQQLCVEHSSKETTAIYTNKDLPSLIKNQKDFKKIFGKNPIFIINKVEQLNAILGNNAQIQK